MYALLNGPFEIVAKGRSKLSLKTYSASYGDLSGYDTKIWPSIMVVVRICRSPHRLDVLGRLCADAPVEGNVQAASHIRDLYLDLGA